MQICLTANVAKKNEGIRARLSEDLRARLDAIHQKHLTNDSTVTIRSLEAFCDYVEETGKVEFPVKMTTAKPATAARRAS